MKKTIACLPAFLLILIVAALSVVFADRNQPRYCGDYCYVVLNDGTAEIIMYRGNEKYVKDDFLLLAFLTLSGIAINSVVTGSMIFPQPRYMCYGMGLFYLALTCDIIATKK